jgi:hypothetical protein
MSKNRIKLLKVSGIKSAKQMLSPRFALIFGRKGAIFNLVQFDAVCGMQGICSTNHYESSLRRKIISWQEK